MKNIFSVFQFVIDEEGASAKFVEAFKYLSDFMMLRVKMKIWSIR